MKSSRLVLKMMLKSVCILFLKSINMIVNMVLLVFEFGVGRWGE